MKKQIPIDHKLHGWLAIDKPTGVSSAWVVSQLRKILGVKKIGHAGTLDPFASGVLPLAIGEATKTVSYVQNSEKTYLLTLHFGEARDSDDCEGAVIKTSDARPTLQEIEAVLPEFQGEIMQAPPRFSAIKIDGKRAYARARAGEDFAIAPRPVQIHRLTLKGQNPQGEILLEVTSGKGAYMRVLAREIAEKCNAYAYLSALKRLKCGDFTINNAFSLEQVKKTVQSDKNYAMISPLRKVLVGISALYVTRLEMHKLKNGNEIDALHCKFSTDPHHSKVDYSNIFENETLLALEENGTTPIGLAICSKGKIYPKRIFNL